MGDEVGLLPGVGGRSATIVTESYNLSEGQSFERLAAAVEAALGAQGGPHEVLLLDASDDPRTADLVAMVRSATGATVGHARLPSGTGYDTAKDVGAVLAATDVVAYLDGDCVPEGRPAAWLDALMVALVASGAPGVTGTTFYEGDTALRLACSVLDFGFLLDRPGESLGCYVSNNVAFERTPRVEVRAEVDGLRCSCYLHAQVFVRAGAPLQHVDDGDAIVRHEFPPSRRRTPAPWLRRSGRRVGRRRDGGGRVLPDVPGASSNRRGGSLPPRRPGV